MDPTAALASWSSSAVTHRVTNEIIWVLCSWGTVPSSHWQFLPCRTPALQLPEWCPAETGQLGTIWVWASTCSTVPSGLPSCVWEQVLAQIPQDNILGWQMKAEQKWNASRTCRALRLRPGCLTAHSVMCVGVCDQKRGRNWQWNTTGSVR